MISHAQQGPGARWRQLAAMARRKSNPAFHALALDKPDVANLVGEEIAGLDQLTDSPLRNSEAFGCGGDGHEAGGGSKRILNHSENSIDEDTRASRTERP